MIKRIYQGKSYFISCLLCKRKSTICVLCAKVEKQWTIDSSCRQSAKKLCAWKAVPELCMLLAYLMQVLIQWWGSQQDYHLWWSSHPLGCRKQYLPVLFTFIIRASNSDFSWFPFKNFFSITTNQLQPWFCGIYWKHPTLFYEPFGVQREVIFKHKNVMFLKWSYTSLILSNCLMSRCQNNTWSEGKFVKSNFLQLQPTFMPSR